MNVTENDTSDAIEHIYIYIYIYIISKNKYFVLLCRCSL